MQKIETILRALANKRRLSILLLLRKRENICVKDIADVLHFSYKATSKHLAKLRAADVVKSKQWKSEMQYSLSKPNELLDLTFRLLKS